ncbi:hypothetical protein HMPREF9136_0144 [Prevotella dentalis DSM 3688]|uniref:Uncharacterized protein n=1 Tax=Prevotella dentalis (strain ATCC 49559 / DSM 3688 / JCM 13448 / NCTC 12043 / ES 2772) TaxID=908937 RepID=F9CZW7_PREDD|nr:hypothetical protein HMPREF9136_0144 [Prevotella dentalis DSM 3688]
MCKTKLGVFGGMAKQRTVKKHGTETYFCHLFGDMMDVFGFFEYICILIS